jgi:hypothetical protein
VQIFIALDPDLIFACKAGLEMSTYTNRILKGQQSMFKVQSVIGEEQGYRN